MITSKKYCKEEPELLAIYTLRFKKFGFIFESFRHGVDGNGGVEPIKFTFAAFMFTSSSMLKEFCAVFKLYLFNNLYFTFTFHAYTRSSLLCQTFR